MKQRAKLSDIETDIDYKRARGALDVEKDIANYNWYERFNPVERSLRQNRERLAAAKEQATLMGQEQEFVQDLREQGYTPEQINQLTQPIHSGKSGGFFSSVGKLGVAGTTGLLIGGGLVAYFLLKKGGK